MENHLELLVKLALKAFGELQHENLISWIPLSRWTS